MLFKALLPPTLALAGAWGAAAADVDFDKMVGPMKPEHGVYALAATDGEGIGKVFFANIGPRKTKVEFAAPGWELLSCQLTDEDHFNTVIAKPTDLPADSFGVMTFVR